MSKPAPKPFAFTPREVMEEIAALTGGRCLLAFSRGKDAIVAIAAPFTKEAGE